MMCFGRWSRNGCSREGGGAYQRCAFHGTLSVVRGRAAVRGTGNHEAYGGHNSCLHACAGVCVQTLAHWGGGGRGRCVRAFCRGVCPRRRRHRRGGRRAVGLSATCATSRGSPMGPTGAWQQRQRSVLVRVAATQRVVRTASRQTSSLSVRLSWTMVPSPPVCLLGVRLRPLGWPSSFLTFCIPSDVSMRQEGVWQGCP